MASAMSANLDEWTPRRQNHRSWVGVNDYFDRLGAVQFVTLLRLGMREESRLLDVGCGCLRGGRFSLLYLNPECYYGIDSEGWTIEAGISHEIGESLVALKRPAFSTNEEFNATQFGLKFDYVMISGIFMHTSSRLIKQIVSNMEAVLSENGMIVGTFIEGYQQDDLPDWTYPEIQSYSRREMRLLVEKSGLRLYFLPFSHPLRHTWFVLLNENSTHRLNDVVDYDPFSWEEYLKFQIEKRNGDVPSYEKVLRHRLSEVKKSGDGDIVPQATYE